MSKAKRLIEHALNLSGLNDPQSVSGLTTYYEDSAGEEIELVVTVNFAEVIEGSRVTGHDPYVESAAYAATGEPFDLSALSDDENREMACYALENENREMARFGP